ncbi:MAG: sigma-70 family RNA polymerase sigma factor [Ignavibacteria bacterium]|nr:sigma-70 family RNA polymerase sigma factor [Ignavibacteria bacterium]
MNELDDLTNWTDIELCLAMTRSHKEAERAFTEIYNRYSRNLYAYILRTQNDRTNAKDIYQEVFLRFCDSVKKGTRVHNILFFLIKIARNICINNTRANKQFIQFDENEYPFLSMPSVEKDELVSIVTNALNLLEYTSREIFILRHYQEFTFQEIAEIMGETLATIKSRYYRAREKLKEHLLPFFKNEY